MRLTRHAKNYLRRLGASVEDVERVIREPLHFDLDRKGKPRYTGRIQGVRVRVVVALDEPDLIVTIHDRRR
jgi:mRNA-degrading endonuclease RelE of RelBE toxin-antitoxin system